MRTPSFLDDGFREVEFPFGRPSFCERQHLALLAVSVFVVGFGVAAGPLRALYYGADMSFVVIGAVIGILVSAFLTVGLGAWREWSNGFAVCFFVFGVSLTFFGSFISTFDTDEALVVNGKASFAHDYLVAVPFVHPIEVIPRAWLLTAGATTVRVAAGMDIQFDERHTLKCRFPLDESVIVRLSAKRTGLEAALRQSIESAAAARQQGDFFPTFGLTDRLAFEEVIRLELKLTGFPDDACALVRSRMRATADQDLVHRNL